MSRLILCSAGFWVRSGMCFRGSVTLVSPSLQCYKNRSVHSQDGRGKVWGHYRLL